ncbi:MAG: MG2 domain-containing protein, partial [Planctomycetota bacterium]
MRRSICIFVLSFIVSSVFLIGSRCNGGGTYIAPIDWFDYPVNVADLTESIHGRMTVDESRMLVSSGDGVINVGLPVMNKTASTIYGTVHLELRDSMTKIVKSVADSPVILEPGETYAVVGMLSYVADETTAIKAGHTIVWRVQSYGEIVEGQKALLSGASLEYIKVIGPKTVFEGFPTSYRLVAVHPETGEPLNDAAVEIQFAKDGNRISTLIGTTDGYGRFTGSLTLPAGVEGPITLRCAIRKDEINELFEQELQVGGGYKILLTTDKPQYQPGQLIHLRTLGLTQPGRSPLAYTTATFEIFDGKQNKVFKSITTTNAYGVANSTFLLASELCTGDYTAKVT